MTRTQISPHTAPQQKTLNLQVQGQVYHHAGSLLPIADAPHEFLQIYFIGDDDREADVRCGINSRTKRDVILRLQAMLHQHNELVRVFKTAIDRMPSDNHQIVIRPDKAPPTEHSRRFNAPTIDDVAIVIVGEQFQQRDIVLQRRNEQLIRVPETHRSFDSLQYPIMFPRGEDGYHLTMKMVNPSNGKLYQEQNVCTYKLKTHTIHAHTNFKQVRRRIKRLAQ